MREFTCDSLLEWYVLLQQNVRDLGDEHFESFTPTERDELRADLLEEIRKDYAFKNWKKTLRSWRQVSERIFSYL